MIEFGPGRDPDVLTAEELGAKLGIEVQTIRKLVNRGELPGLRVGKDFRFSWRAVKDTLRDPHPEPDPQRIPSAKILEQARQAARRVLSAQDSPT